MKETRTRARNVTRTVKTTEATAMCLDTVNAEVMNKTYIVGGFFEDDDALLMAVCRAETDKTIKPCQIVLSNRVTALYGMPEDEFLKYAKVLKEVDTEEAEVAE